MAANAKDVASQVEKTNARKWKKELSLATKREKDWLANAEKIVKRYRGEEKKRNRYNVLWATTETLRPAIYNSKPNPDVRRRFRDSDPVGKAVGEVLERSLFVLFDADEPDASIKNDLLDSLLSGRGVSRIRYVPKLAEAGQTMPMRMTATMRLVPARASRTRTPKAPMSRSRTSRSRSSTWISETTAKVTDALGRRSPGYRSATS